MPGGYDVLKERGFVQQWSNEEGLKELLDRENIPLYAGFDPTGPSLQVGHLVPVFAMAHLQRAGHKPIVLVGGGTARIGDPSGKTETRKMLTYEDIKANAASMKKQLSRFLDFSNDKAVMVDNTDWLADLNYIDFLREIGKHFSVNRMLSFEAYKMRMETGLTFIEFNYQLLQSYDFLILYRKYGCLLQMGGDDQWGNIVSGIELIRRIEGREVFAATVPLLIGADGKKMGKTEKGALFLDPELVSPYEFYQYWVNIADKDVEKCLSFFTFLPMDEVKRLGTLKDREINEAKQVLAFELTKIVHGENAAEEARDATMALFGKKDLSQADNIPTTEFSIPDKPITVVDFISISGLFNSKSEVRRLVQQGGAYINDKNYKDINEELSPDFFSKPVIIRAGKKRYWKMVPVKKYG